MFIRPMIVFAPSDGPAGDTAPAAAPASTPAPSSPAAEPPTSAALTDPAPAAAPDTGVPGALTDPAAPAEPPKQEAAPAIVKPEDYTVEYPEGVSGDSDYVKAFLEQSAADGLSNAQVQSIVNKIGPMLRDQTEAPFRAWQEMNQQWQTEVRNDPEIGGAKLAASMQTIQNAISIAVPDPTQAAAVHEALRLTGAGNNPAIVRLLHAMSVRLTENPVVQGGGPAPQQPSMAARMYPSAQPRKTA